MPVFDRLSVLLCHAVVPVLVVLLSVSGHPQAFPCRLMQSTALCKNCQLSAVPNHLPPQIEEIYLDKNLLINLQDGCLSRYPILRTCSCANNHLRTVEENVFSESPLIENLNFADNELHDGHKQVAQSFSPLSQLKTLDLSGNGLTEDMVSVLLQNLSSLESLYLSRNVMLRLDETTFRNLHQLKELNVERNLLFEIDGAFYHMKKLQRLNLAFNCLPCLVNFEMTQLLVLNASHNSIEWFITNQNLSETFQLETLDLSDNHLLFFPFLPTHNHIRTLILSNNWVSFYQDFANATSSNWTTKVEFYNLGQNVGNVTMELWNESLHGDISSVELLDLSENKVDNFPQGFIQQMPRLNWLRLRSNCLQSFSLTPEDLPVTLYELDVSKNRLTELKASQSTISKLNNLTYLNLSTNDIQKLSPTIFANLPSLSTVDLSHNPVDVCFSEESNYSSSTCVLWSNIVTLKKLYLEGCGIQNMPPSPFKGTPLTHLELSNNLDLHIKQESLAGLSNTLEHLGLGNTGLQDFDFSPYSHLRSLNISRNSMSEFPESLVALNLRLLDLRDNMLTTIPSKHATILAQRLQAVYLNGNAFNCCHLDWYRTFVENKGISVVDLSEITCLDFNLRHHKVMLFDAVHCGGISNEESFVWYILLFVTVSVSIVGISVIYLLTFRPKMLPRAIKKRWRPTPY
ncbi:transforming growth factor beta activator LRRC33-like isoform X1 [Myxocyprinus asiaticus]|uniref:transforming growth factor beta activator LRRC33-like isoform X1 n=2 Tax=Myxocyprinus asiaticus TaxID=70543 RepID=UPI002222C788|nr:transforming growth factor beta activator LRRC33-like isoform X1 [Myxocyprinus asiaticus]XP_051538461.1 transforming growth factor beta activator LRRC33-like isoform X1 [Myxocyprinus asiaticus]